MKRKDENINKQYRDILAIVLMINQISCITYFGSSGLHFGNMDIVIGFVVYVL